MSVQSVSYPCTCGAIITEWQRYDLGGVEIVHGEGAAAPAFFVPDEEVGRGRSFENAAKIDAFVAEVHGHDGIVTTGITPSKAAIGALIGGVQRAVRMLEAEQ